MSDLEKLYDQLNKEMSPEERKEVAHEEKEGRHFLVRQFLMDSYFCKYAPDHLMLKMSMLWKEVCRTASRKLDKAKSGMYHVKGKEIVWDHDTIQPCSADKPSLYSKILQSERVVGIRWEEGGPYWKMISHLGNGLELCCYVREIELEVRREKIFCPTVGDFIEAPLYFKVYKAGVYAYRILTKEVVAQEIQLFGEDELTRLPYEKIFRELCRTFFLAYQTAETKRGVSRDSHRVEAYVLLNTIFNMNEPLEGLVTLIPPELCLHMLMFWEGLVFALEKVFSIEGSALPDFSLKQSDPLVERVESKCKMVFRVEGRELSCSVRKRQEITTPFPGGIKLNLYLLTIREGYFTETICLNVDVHPEWKQRLIVRDRCCQFLREYRQHIVTQAV